MGRPVFFAENFYNGRLFTSHTISANEEAANSEAFRVGSGRRNGSLRKWTPTTNNSAAWIEVKCDRSRAADMIVIDRGHNLGGHTIRLEVSDDNFATDTDVFSLTVPTSTLVNTRLDETPGVRTEEGAWMFRFNAHAGRYWRLFIPAMGSGLKPEIVGLYLGLSYRPQFPQARPFDFGQRELLYDQITSPTGWVGAGQIAQRSRGRMHLKMADREEYDRARYTIEELFGTRRPMWHVFDEDRAELSRLGYAPPGTHGFQVRGRWGFMQGEWEWVEHEPEIVD